MWTPEIIRIRFVEAADTERYLPRPFTAGGKGYWPQHLYDEEDRAGWDEQAKADNAARPSSRAPAGAVTRHSECLEWTSVHISDKVRRQIVWGYAFCRAHKREFGKLCDRRGWVKRTAYDRLHKIWDRLSTQFTQEGLTCREPSEFWLAQETNSMAHPSLQSAPIADVPTAIRFTPSFMLERPTDLIVTDDDAADFAKFLASHNAAMRREQARRRKLGLIEEATASPAL